MKHIRNIKSIFHHLDSSKKFHTFLTGLQDAFYPPRCVLCDGILLMGEQGIHESCRPDLLYVGDGKCMHCGRPVIGRAEYCPDCQRKLRKYNYITFKQGKALFLYKKQLKQSMYRFKYSNRREYATFYAKEAAALYSDWLYHNQISAIVPVPMFKKKQKARGYNQAETFAKALSLETGIPLLKNLVIRCKDTAPMKELNDIERKNNLENAFQVTTNIVQYYYILVVDDIYTTGSTADAVTDVLLKAGAKEVYFMSICVAGT